MTPAHVSSRYHQSLRDRLICKGTVVPIDNAKLMVFFLLILAGACWSRWAVCLAESIYNLHKKGVRRGVFSIDTGLELVGVVGPFVGPDRYITYIKRVVRHGAFSIDTRYWVGACWSRLAFRRARSIYNLHKKGGPTGGGGCRPPLRCLSQFISYKKE